MMRSSWTALAVVSVVLMTSSYGPSFESDTTQAVRNGVADELDHAAIAAAERFLDTYVGEDGRAVRHDQGGDTVSEGQGYAMLVAAAIGDEPTFERVWRWTDRELGRGDGLFAWRWSNGEVVDDESASDADLFIAGALSVAGRRFSEPEYTRAALRTSEALLTLATVEIDGRRVLTAGPWATEQRIVNPSYWALPLMSRLWWDGAWGWASVASSARQALDRLTIVEPHLPPDWAVAETSKAGGFAVEPLGDPSHFGWEAVRIPVQSAATCSRATRSVAARLWPFFLSQDLQIAAVYGTDGSVVDDTSHTTALVAAAAAASASGAIGSAQRLLERAERRDAEHPTYYGAAWLALGRLWLTTSMLGGCANR